MAKHIGIVACSAEGAALCYRTICSEASELMGEHFHPEISMHTFPLGEYMKYIRAGDWKEVGALILASIQKLDTVGAEFVICPDNTIHQAYSFVMDFSPLPWIHIVDAVAGEARREGYKNLAVTGTKYLMTGPVYPEILKKYGISHQIPEEEDRNKIDSIIFKELVNGIFLESSRLLFNGIVMKLKNLGCDAVVLGCTEIPLLVDPDDCPLPSLDSTRLLARVALHEAVL